MELPTEIILTAEDSGFKLSDNLCEEINDYLADKYGCCNGGWAIEMKLTNIDWDDKD